MIKLHHKPVTIYTDGACKNNPGPGGWAAILICDSQEKIITGREPYTTNNRMELMSVIAGLEALTRKGLNIVIYSDSQYVVKAVKDNNIFYISATHPDVDEANYNIQFLFRI